MPTDSCAAVGLIRAPCAIALAVPGENGAVSARDATGAPAAAAAKAPIPSPATIRLIRMCRVFVTVVTIGTADCDGGHVTKTSDGYACAAVLEYCVSYSSAYR